jgi:hypothetical protein
MSDMRQSISIASDITGSDNRVDQYADTYSYDNSLTNATMVQTIREMADSMGCDNEVNQDVVFLSEDNTMTGGYLVQNSTIVTND